MADCRTFNGVTATVFACVKQQSAQQHGTVYAPPDGTSGTATTSTPVGTVIVSFDLDTAAGSITYCLLQKPLLAPESAIWNGISSTISGCQQSGKRAARP
jgi:hypothetical protein